MSTKSELTWYENDRGMFPAHFHAANLMDLLQQRDISSHLFLKKTKIFYEDIKTGKVNLSAQQFCQFLDNAKNLYREPELSFRWGHGLFPGHFDGFSQALSHGDTLNDLLNTFCKFPQLTPMMRLRRWEDEHTVYLQWVDEIGLANQYDFLVEGYSTAIISLVNWFYSEKLPWRLGFSMAEPRNREEYEVNLGPDLQFELGVDIIMLERSWLDQVIPEKNRKPISQAALSIALSQCEDDLKHLPMGIIQCVLSLQVSKLPESISLNSMAQLLGMSSATLKRKLAKHDVTYQRIQDLARLNVSLELIQKRGLKNTELADQLNITDANNFRKAFKRWSGMTPAAIKKRLAHGYVS